MERTEVRETIAGVILRGVVATCGVERVFGILCEIEAEEKSLAGDERYRDFVLGESTTSVEIENFYAEVNPLEKEMVLPPSLPTESGEKKPIIVKYGNKEYDATFGRIGKAREYIKEYFSVPRKSISQKDLNLYLTGKKKAKWSSWTTAIAVKSLVQEKFLLSYKAGRDIMVAPVGANPPVKGGVPWKERPGSEKYVEEARDAILKELGSERVRKTDFLREVAKKHHLSFGPLWGAYSLLLKEGQIEQSKEGGKIFFTLFVPSEKVEEEPMKRGYGTERAKADILRMLPSDGTPVAKTAFLQEFKGSYGTLWTAVAILEAEKKVCHKEIGGVAHIALCKAVEEESIHSTVPVKKVAVEKDRAREVILFHLRRHEETGMPNEHLVGMCLMDNISNMGARMALASLYDEGIIRYDTAENCGVWVKHSYLTEKGKGE